MISGHHNSSFPGVFAVKLSTLLLYKGKTARSFGGLRMTKTGGVCKHRMTKFRGAFANDHNIECHPEAS